jgi:hypothetical protein
MYNNEFRVIDSQDKAYFLGMMYADGCVSTTPRKENGSVIYKSALVLNKGDVSLLEAIKASFPIFHTYPFNNGRGVEIRNTNKECYLDLVNNGCLPRKSFENRYDLHLPNLPEELISHFIRGYFDGDGGCALSFSNKKTQKRVYIYSASPQLLEEFKSYLECKNIRCTMDKGHNEGILCYKLSISTASYKLFYNLLYQNANLKMQRKYDKFSQIMQTNFFIQKEAPNCKFCGSFNTVCDGYNTYKFIRQRYLCKDCKKHFSASVRSNSNG